MHLALVVRVFRRWFWAVILGTVIAGLIGRVATPRAIPTYRASTSIWITTSAVPGVYTSATDLVSYATIYAPLVQSTDVLQRALTDIGDKSSPASIQGEVAAVPNPRSSIIDIQVTDANPTRAMALANAIAEAFATSNPNPSTIQSIMSFATSATLTTNPLTGRLTTIAAALLGFLLTAGAVVAVEANGNRVGSPGDLEEILGLRFLGRLPPVRRRKNESGDPIADPAGEEADTFRRIRPSILHALGSRPTELLVVSPSVDVDRGSIILNLAASFAETGLRVTVIDADPETAWLAPALGVPERIGLVDVIQRTNVAPRDAVRALRIPGVAFVSAGNASVVSAAVLSSPRFRQVIDDIQRSADLILCGCAPAARRSDASVLATHLGQTLLLIDAQREPRETILRCTEEIERSGSTIIGAIVVNAEPSYFQLTQGGSKEQVFSVQAPDSALANGVLRHLPVATAEHFSSDGHARTMDRVAVNHQQS